MGVSNQDKVVLTLDNVAAEVTEHQVQIHPQKAEMGMRVMKRFNQVRLLSFIFIFFDSVFWYFKINT